MKLDLYIEVFGKKIEHKVIVEKVKEIWKADGNKVKDLSNLEVYYKPEEQMCYYVINGEVEGSFSVAE